MATPRTPEVLGMTPVRRDLLRSVLMSLSRAVDLDWPLADVEAIDGMLEDLGTEFELTEDG